MSNNTYVSAWDNSKIQAWDNCTVDAQDNSTVEAFGNTQVIVNFLKNGKVMLNGNARKIYMPRNAHEFINYYDIKHNEKTAIFYKAVRKIDGKLRDYYGSDYIYEVGEYKSGEEMYISNLNGALNWVNQSNPLNYISRFDDFVIIEVETNIYDISLHVKFYGTATTSKLKVLREVPLEECGVYGKILAVRR